MALSLCSASLICLVGLSSCERREVYCYIFCSTLPRTTGDPLCWQRMAVMSQILLTLDIYLWFFFFFIVNFFPLIFCCNRFLYPVLSVAEHKVISAFSQGSTDTWTYNEFFLNQPLLSTTFQNDNMTQSFGKWRVVQQFSYVISLH